MRFLALILSLVVISVQAGDLDFRNLGFDEGKTGSLRPDRGEFGAAAELLPAWTVRFGDSTETTVGYNASPWTSLFSNYASVWGKDFVPSAVQGQFGFYMLTLNGALGTPSVSQLGQVPAGIKYLGYSFFGYNPVVTFEGHVLKRVAPESMSRVRTELTDVYLDISEYAGGFGELRFSLDFRGPGGAGDLFLDNIRLTNVIPEPGVVSILALGGALFAFRQWRHRRGCV
jgi:hypothetical protein